MGGKLTLAALVRKHGSSGGSGDREGAREVAVYISSLADQVCRQSRQP